MYMRLSLILIAGLLAGCVAPTGPTGVPGSSTQQTGTTPGPVQASFAAVVARAPLLPDVHAYSRDRLP